MSCKVQNTFLWFSKDSWIARMSKITFMKFYKSWKVLQASKYFCMIFKSILDCQKVQNNYPNVWQVLECIASFKIFFYDFLSLLYSQNVQDNFPEVLQVLECNASFKIFFYDFYSLMDCQNVQDNLTEGFKSCNVL